MLTIITDNTSQARAAVGQQAELISISQSIQTGGFNYVDAFAKSIMYYSVGAVQMQEIIVLVGEVPAM